MNKSIRYCCLPVFVLVIFISSVSSVFSANEMVEISVEVTEINNNKANELGIKWTDTIKAGEVSYSAANRDPALLPEVPSIVKVGEWSRYSALTAELKILQEKGAAQILSKPKILTKSGTTAKVIVGGEIPIVASGVGGGTIQWKEFGIKTEIMPKILADDYIDLVLTTEVSRLDWANQAGGYPAIMKREATSSIKIKSGQTITLAGLIETKKEEKSSGIPLLCDIPVIGYLFSRKTLNETKTNVLIFVTPRIVE
jgi:pilus assembly protein CpaC